ncbi:MAG: NAD(P)H-hydrate dehydratase, partial [Clostridia bacterium]
KCFDLREKSVAVFCGKGNNGSDGYRIAMLLHRLGKDVRAVSVFEPKTEECIRLAEDCRNAGIEIIPFDKLGSIGCDAVVDAIFGIGISGEVTGTARKAIEYINGLNAFVLSADIPSGLDADSGVPCGVCVRADKTVTFTAPKLGMISNESVEYCGDIVVRPAGIPVTWSEILSAQPTPLIPETVAPLLPRRPRLSHKGTFGRLVMIAGSRGMMGAAAIAARAAQRSGCGLVIMVCEKGMENTVNIMVPEAVVIPVEEYNLASSPRLSEAISGAGAVLIGCGSGKSLSSEFIKSVLETAPCPVVLDADGLNTVAEHTDMLKGKNLVLTPHPLEFSRLTKKSVSEIESNRLVEAVGFAIEYGVTLVLKGARTVIAEKGGETAVSLNSTSALARGGSGDVLSGVISALCAQGISPADSAKLGVYLHSLSGKISAARCGEYSSTINDIIENLKLSFMEVESYE